MESQRQIYERIRKCWGPDTSSDPTGWRQSNPAWRQCAVTACIVQDLLGGEIVWTKAVSPDTKEHSHYFNVLSNGSVVDMTREQFPSDTVFVPEVGCQRTQNGSGKAFANTREYILSYPATFNRYTILPEQNTIRSVTRGFSRDSPRKIPVTATTLQLFHTE